VISSCALETKEAMEIGRQERSEHLHQMSYVPSHCKLNQHNATCVLIFFPSWILSQVKTVLDLPGLNFASLTGFGRLLFCKHLRIIE
jgi:hypothetical protein